ncbi:MAG TPA: tRNA (guanosine(46)-N7)-methyltransferase TrmB [Acidiferrobacteraceae bacterium]|nr:tRNA (guanosine(46)-N7)-methyltransferase TrmB [Acidiferrobacteraceae bacterium]
MCKLENRRPIRSFVRREGRMTDAQRRALDELWPHYGVDLGEGELDFVAVLGRSAPVIMEIGFGNGESLVQMALAQPGNNYLGVEVHRPGIGRMLGRIKELGLNNLKVVCGDATEVLKTHVAKDALDGVHIFFPDPWPKKRHHKRRLLQANFIRLVERALKPGGRLHIATDWQEYADHIVELMASIQGFENVAGKEIYSPRPDYRPLTKYEARGERLGHAVHDIVFKKRGE